MNCQIRKKQILDSGLQLAFTEDTDGGKVFLPTDNFCVRKPAAIFADGKYWIYADVVPWSNPHWPDTYDTSIHAFSSCDCRKWEYHGEVIAHQEANSWDLGGVATPGAVVLNDHVHIFYSGREKIDADGIRQIGMAVADNPLGPFIKTAKPVIVPVHPETHLDDPIPILSENGKEIDLYFRQAEHQLDPSQYSIRLSKSTNSGTNYSKSIPVLKSNANIRACETAEVVRIGKQVLLSTFDHLQNGSCKTAFRLSENGIDFKNCKNLYLDDHLCCGWDIPSCMLQIVLIPDVDGKCRHLGITRPVDNKGHYNLGIYDIERLGE
jgi:Glycosyl hydrolases family 32 N-terminal domain